MNPKTVGLVVLEHVTAVDVTGPAEVFARAKIRAEGQLAVSKQPRTARSDGSARSVDVRSCYQVLTLNVGEGSCVTECGIEIKPHSNIEAAPPLDTLFVCGCSQTHDSRWSRKLTKWLKNRLSFTRRIVGI